MNKTKFAIGCLVQWYECEIIGDYIKSLQKSINTYEGEVLIDIKVVINQDLEKCEEGKMDYCLQKIKESMGSYTYKITKKLVTIADYRRKFNTKYCDKADVLVWGESDAILPTQMFTILDNLHQMSLANQQPKYLAFFGTCKMWDDTWKSVEHTEFTNKPLDPTKWWGTRYKMTYAEMVKINDKVSELDVRIVSPHKFNGCGLVISSEVIRAGVNIPKSVFFVHEDTAFMQMTNRILGDIPQYIIKNILLVHNRNRTDKRMYIQDDSGDNMKKRRFSNKWYELANKMSEQNCYSLFNNNYKSFNWKDVWKNI